MIDNFPLLFYYDIYISVTEFEHLQGLIVKLNYKAE